MTTNDYEHKEIIFFTLHGLRNVLLLHLSFFIDNYRYSDKGKAHSDHPSFVHNFLQGKKSCTLYIANIY